MVEELEVEVDAGMENNGEGTWMDRVQTNFRKLKEDARKEARVTRATPYVVRDADDAPAPSKEHLMAQYGVRSDEVSLADGVSHPHHLTLTLATTLTLSLTPPIKAFHSYHIDRPNPDPMAMTISSFVSPLFPAVCSKLIPVSHALSTTTFCLS